MWIVECGIKLDGQTGYGARGVLARSCCLVSNYKIVYISFASDQVTYKQILNVKTLKFMLYADDILLVLLMKVFDLIQIASLFMSYRLL